VKVLGGAALLPTQMPGRHSNSRVFQQPCERREFYELLDGITVRHAEARRLLRAKSAAELDRQDPVHDIQPEFARVLDVVSHLLVTSSVVQLGRLKDSEPWAVHLGTVLQRPRWRRVAPGEFLPCELNPMPASHAELG